MKNGDFQLSEFSKIRCHTADNIQFNYSKLDVGHYKTLNWCTSNVQCGSEYQKYDPYPRQIQDKICVYVRIWL